MAGSKPGAEPWIAHIGARGMRVRSVQPFSSSAAEERREIFWEDDDEEEQIQAAAQVQPVQTESATETSNRGGAGKARLCLKCCIDSRSRRTLRVNQTSKRLKNFEGIKMKIYTLP